MGRNLLKSGGRRGAQTNRVAEAYLTRLAEHEFESWPQNICEALAPIAQPPSPARPEPAIVSHPAPVVVSGPSLYDAFDEWKRRKSIVGNHKTADEFETAIRRFEILCGTGLFPETIDPVTVDVALTVAAKPSVVKRLTFARHRDKSIWLVPEGAAPFLQLRPEGLAISTVTPFKTADERSDAVCRAAAEIVRIGTRSGRN